MSAIDCIQQIVRNTVVDKKDIINITCTTQGETIIPVDSHGNALHNAIVWLDTRAGNESIFIKKKISSQDFYKNTGCPEISPIWPLAKILWLKNNKPDIYNKTHKILLLEDFLISKLTGRFVTNSAVACSTGYINIQTGKLWGDMLGACDIDECIIPEILPCGTYVGNLSEDAAKQLGLFTDTMLSTGAMDQIASAVGSGNITDGIVTETTGTAQVIAATCSKPKLNELSPVTVYAHALKEKYLLINISQTAGIILKWFRDEFCKDILIECGDKSFAAMDELAEKAPILSNGLILFPHYTGIQI